MEFRYLTTKVKDMVAHPSRSSTGKVTVPQMDIDGHPYVPTPRFWTALQANYGFSTNMFKYFTHKEVFDRISEVVPNDQLQICVEVNQNGPDNEPSERLLAVSNPGKIVVKHDDLVELLGKQGLNNTRIDYGAGNRLKSNHSNDQPTHIHSIPPSFGRGSIGTGGTMLTSTGANSGPGILGDGIRSNDGTVAGATPAIQLENLAQISYHEGIMRSIHKVRNGSDFQIGGDEFCNRFVLDVPLDGYGKPAAYLVMLRVICSNLAIGYSSVFRSEISLGKGEDKFDYALSRAIEGYNNEEGFAALRQRFEMAQRSWCSVNEVNKAYKALIRLHAKGEVTGVAKRFMGAEADKKDQFEGVMVAEGSPIIQSFHKLVGDLHRSYGLANLDALSNKRQATLPSGAKMYDMINFLSETATHRATPAGQRVLQAHIGDLVSAEYDLEGTVDRYGDWREFLISDSTASQNLQYAKSL